MSTYTNCTPFVLETPSSLNSTQMSSIRRRCLYFPTFLTPGNIPPFRFWFFSDFNGSLTVWTVDCRSTEKGKDWFRTRPHQLYHTQFTSQGNRLRL